MKAYLSIKRIFLFTVLLLGSSVGRCQIYKYIGLEDGLSNQKIYHIQKDRRGYMWFLTQEGIDRYDGKRIKHYNFSDDSMKLDSRIALERRKELVCEGHRWFDLIRTGKAIEVMKAHFANTTGYNGVSLNENNLVQPVPLSQIDTDSSIKQNKGYI